MQLIDNVHLRLSDDLKASINKGSRISIAASTFSIYAFEALKKELKSIESLRFIFTSPTFIEEKIQQQAREFYIPHIYNEAQLCGGAFELRLKNELNQRAIAKECANWVKQKVQFKTNRHSHIPLSSILHVENEHNSVAYNNVLAFTTADLGLSHRSGFPTLIQKVESPQSEAYLAWFNQVWNNQESLKDVTAYVQAYFENTIKENSPEFIYFITLYNIFNEFLDDIAADNLPNDDTGFKQSIIWNKLYNFQQDAVIGAINKLEKYNGCIIADSVGLGKTFTALGIIKYYEELNKGVLVLCPKKLEANWNTYRYNDKNNILAADRFSYDVLFHTDLSRERGMSNGRNLEHVNWGNYSLVVIDESHNFRNNNTVVGKENRYQKLLRKIMQEGIKTKVLMLSATPVNNRFNDLKNQLSLAYEGDSEKIDGKLNTERSIDVVFRRAQQAFNVWSKLEASERSTERLLNMLDFDFFEILDSLTIARSRKQITTYYDTSAIGKFPSRNKPEAIYAKLSEEEKAIDYVGIAEELTLLNLSVYSPLNYILSSKVSLYADKYDKKVKSGTFKQQDREKSLQLLMRINLLKRIESSVDSFRLTLDNIINQISNTLSAINKNTLSTVSGLDIDSSDENYDWEADWGDEESVIGTKVKVNIADLDKTRWIEDLEADLAILQKIYSEVNHINASKDLKILKLKELIAQKIEKPLNDFNKKVIIFTAFADTANYLYSQLKDYLWDNFQLHSALVTGSRRACSSKNIPTDLNTLLTCFSPISKGKTQLSPHIKDTIDILIATDCISEGQNLQDCDYLINYDIHWNPVRIIQRFGRIDRIGSINSNITMVNFWPDVTLDAYINLKQRVENRMLISNMTSTGDDNILNTDEKDLEYRKIQLKKLQEEVIDLEDIKEGVSITDLGLNDFRVDLSNFMKKYGALKYIPEGLYAVTDNHYQFEKGVIFILKNVNTTINIDKINRLHPYYLVYLSNEGQTISTHTDAKKTLDVLRLISKDKTQPLEDLCKQVSDETEDFRKMDFYSNLLGKAINTILKTEEEKDIHSLFKIGGTTALSSKIKGIEDFQLISFFIIK